MADKDFRVKQGIVVGGDAFISNSITSVNSISFVDTQEFEPGRGSLAWANTEGSLSLGLTDTLQGHLLQDSFYYVINKTGFTIPANTVVMANGTVGNSGSILISPAIGNGTFPSDYVMGITAHSIPDQAEGYVTSFGKVRGIDTSMFSEGDILYLNPAVPGTMMNTAPIAPNNKVTVAIVVTKSVNQGELFVRPTYADKMNGLQDVYTASIADGQSLVWVAANSRFENKTIAGDVANLYNTYTTLTANTYNTLLAAQANDFNSFTTLTANDYNSFTTLTANIYNTFAYLNANIGSGSNTATANLVSDQYVVTTSNIFTLTQSVVDANNILVSMDGIVQSPNDDYVVSGLTLSINNTAPIPSGTEVEVRHINGTSISNGSTETWTIITSNQTLSVGNGYFVDVTSSPIVVTLPASPTLGNKIRIIDVAGLSEINQLTVVGNGEKIQRSSSNLEVSSNAAAFTLIYSNSTYGWILGEV
jgi:hypothetical protein